MEAGGEAERKRQRLRAALRDNLKRRKARGRDPAPAAADGSTAAEGAGRDGAARADSIEPAGEDIA